MGAAGIPAAVNTHASGGVVHHSITVEAEPGSRSEMDHVQAVCRPPLPS
jgi:hypothetical protein